MNTDIIHGSMRELKGEIKHTWSKLTDEDINSFDGGVDQFLGKVQKTYGFTKERAIEEFDKFKHKNPKFFQDTSPRTNNLYSGRDHAESMASHYLDEARHMGSRALRRSSDVIKEHPGYSLMGAAAVGFLLGAYVCRRSSH